MGGGAMADGELDPVPVLQIEEPLLDLLLGWRPVADGLVPPHQHRSAIDRLDRQPGLEQPRFVHVHCRRRLPVHQEQRHQRRRTPPPHPPLHHHIRVVIAERHGFQLLIVRVDQADLPGARHRCPPPHRPPVVALGRPLLDVLPERHLDPQPIGACRHGHRQPERRREQTHLPPSPLVSHLIRSIPVDPGPVRPPRLHRHRPRRRQHPHQVPIPHPAPTDQHLLRTPSRPQQIPHDQGLKLGPKPIRRRPHPHVTHPSERTHRVGRPAVDVEPGPPSFRRRPPPGLGSSRVGLSRGGGVSQVGVQAPRWVIATESPWSFALPSEKRESVKDRDDADFPAYGLLP